MKKHITIIVFALLSLATVFSGCKKNPDDNPTDAKKQYMVRYDLSNVQEFTHPLTGEVITFTISPCFKANFSYMDANGQMVELNDVTLPWSKEFTVEAPFTEKIEGSMNYVESELPEEITYGTPVGIRYKRIGNDAYSGDIDGNAATTDKERFLQLMELNPDRLKFSKEVNIE